MQTYKYLGIKYTILRSIIKNRGDDKDNSEHFDDKILPWFPIWTLV